MGKTASSGKDEKPKSNVEPREQAFKNCADISNRTVYRWTTYLYSVTHMDTAQTWVDSQATELLDY